MLSISIWQQYHANIEQGRRQTIYLKRCLLLPHCRRVYHPRDRRCVRRDSKGRAEHAFLISLCPEIAAAADDESLVFIDEALRLVRRARPVHFLQILNVPQVNQIKNVLGTAVHRVGGGATYTVLNTDLISLPTLEFTRLQNLYQPVLARQRFATFYLAFGEAFTIYYAADYFDNLPFRCFCGAAACKLWEPNMTGQGMTTLGEARRANDPNISPLLRVPLP